MIVHIKWNCLIPTNFCLVWSSISCFRDENTNLVIYKSLYQSSFQNTHSKMKANIRLWIYTLNGIVWYLFCLVWSSIRCFWDENVSHKPPIRISDKITTVPGLFSEHLTQNESKHQIMNVYTKWNCLIPISSSLVKY